jgi:hypothetical protein
VQTSAAVAKKFRHAGTGIVEKSFAFLLAAGGAAPHFSRNLNCEPQNPKGNL